VTALSPGRQLVQIKAGLQSAAYTDKLLCLQVALHNATLRFAALRQAQHTGPCWAPATVGGELQAAHEYLLQLYWSFVEAWEGLTAREAQLIEVRNEFDRCGGLLVSLARFETYAEPL
jgi:hypothetical protein